MQDVANGVAMPNILKVLKDRLEGTTGEITPEDINDLYEAIIAPKPRLDYQDFLKRKLLPKERLQKEIS